MLSGDEIQDVQRAMWGRGPLHRRHEEGTPEPEGLRTVTGAAQTAS
jgi:hypothetical protein